MRWFFLTIIFCFSSAALALAQEERPQGWTDASHGNRVPANYEVVLPDDRINELHITFRAEEWQAEYADMAELYGEFGAQREEVPENVMVFDIDIENLDLAAIAEETGIELETLEAAVQYWPNIPAVVARLGPVDLMSLAGAVGFGAADGEARQGNSGFSFVRNPIWVAADVHFEGQTWWEVGFRFKGNSSLSNGWSLGQTGLPFKLDFDEFEDEYPELDNQRFYGFKQLSFSNNWTDASLQREKVAADIFRAAGVPAAETAFYAVYVDIGDGNGYRYWGIYTAVELPDDTLIETQFSDDSGNMYKPEGAGASFAAGSFDEASFDKETNRDSSYEDILRLFEALHAETRESDPAAWRAGLEAVFDAEGFLRWLAANQLLQNWDTYGVIAHNYYLYADPETGSLTWIPWDNNMALRENLAETEVDGTDRIGSRPRLPGGGAGRPGGRYLGVALSIALDEVDERWPLQRFLLDDEVYTARYRALVAEIRARAFNAARMGPIYEANYALLSAYLSEVVGVSEEELMSLQAAMEELKAHALRREAAAAEYLQETAAE